MFFEHNLSPLKMSNLNYDWYSNLIDHFREHSCAYAHKKAIQYVG